MKIRGIFNSEASSRHCLRTGSDFRLVSQYHSVWKATDPDRPRASGWYRVGRRVLMGRPDKHSGNLPLEAGTSRASWNPVDECLVRVHAPEIDKRVALPTRRDCGYNTFDGDVLPDVLRGLRVTDNNWRSSPRLRGKRCRYEKNGHKKSKERFHGI
jgi:hypothetical protein